MNVSTVEEVPQYPDPGIRSDGYSRLTRSSADCEACAKCVPADRPRQSIGKKFTWRSRSFGANIEGLLWRHRVFAYALLAELSGAISAGRWAKSVEVASCWMQWKLCCIACRPIAGQARSCTSAGSQTSLCFQTCGAACSWSAIRSSAAQTSAMRPQISRHSG